MHVPGIKPDALLLSKFENMFTMAEGQSLSVLLKFWQNLLPW